MDDAEFESVADQKEPVFGVVRGLPTGDQRHYHWRPGRWWRVLGPDNELVGETSVETEAWKIMLSYPGSRIQRQYVMDETEWRDL